MSVDTNRIKNKNNFKKLPSTTFKVSLLNIIETKIDDGKKYFEYAKKTNMGKYYIQALFDYKTAEELLNYIRKQRLTEKNRVGIEDLKSGKYDFMIVSKNNANFNDKKFIEDIEKEIKYTSEVTEQENKIVNEINNFLKEKEENKAYEKYTNLLRSENIKYIV